MEQTNIALETNSTALTFAAVRAGAGIGIAAAPLKGSLADGLGVRSMRRGSGRSRYVFIWKDGAIITPVQRELEKCIVACAT